MDRIGYSDGLTAGGSEPPAVACGGCGAPLADERAECGTCSPAVPAQVDEAAFRVRELLRSARGLCLIGCYFLPLILNLAAINKTRQARKVLAESGLENDELLASIQTVEWFAVAMALVSGAVWWAVYTAL